MSFYIFCLFLPNLLTLIYYRGGIHCHILMVVPKGPSEADFNLALRTPVNENADLDLQDLQNEDMVDVDRLEIAKAEASLLGKVNEAKERIKEFACLEVGISSIHPTQDPHLWRPPWGLNTAEPMVNCLCQELEDVISNPQECYEDYTRLVNRVQDHVCSKKYCLKVRKKFKTEEAKKDDCKGTGKDAENPVQQNESAKELSTKDNKGNKNAKKKSTKTTVVETAELQIWISSSTNRL